MTPQRADITRARGFHVASFLLLRNFASHARALAKVAEPPPWFSSSSSRRSTPRTSSPSSFAQWSFPRELLGFGVSFLICALKVFDFMCQ